MNVGTFGDTPTASAATVPGKLKTAGCLAVGLEVIDILGDIAVFCTG